MKIAVISDIHGNMQALDAVLEDIKHNLCEKIFCLGDLAMAGPEPSSVINFVSKQDWEVIQGNTDQLIAEFSPQILENVKNMYPIMGNALADDVLIIGDSEKEYLKNLPSQKEITIEGVKVLLVHGSPRKNNENIFPNLKIEEVEEMLKGVDANLIFCGHTHIPAGYQTSTKQTVVNVGSVGRPMQGEPKACYVIADFQNGAFSIEHKFVSYDKEKAAEIIRNRNFEGAKELANMLTNPTVRHI